MYAKSLSWIRIFGPSERDSGQIQMTQQEKLDWRMKRSTAFKRKRELFSSHVMTQPMTQPAVTTSLMTQPPNYRKIRWGSRNRAWTQVVDKGSVFFLEGRGGSCMDVGKKVGAVDRNASVTFWKTHPCHDVSQMGNGAQTRKSLARNIKGIN